VLLSVPASLINVSPEQTVREGSIMQLLCEAKGKPTPNITWSRVLGDGSNSEVLHHVQLAIFQTSAEMTLQHTAV